jgi:hypothetical protein
MGFFSDLKQMTKPDHNWTVIYLMSLAYMVLIFPGCYLLGARRIDYRIVYGALLSAVILFSLGFSIIGRRGYGEATAVHSIAIARPLGDGQFDVTAWSNVFVTGGGDYAISHEGTGALYSTCQDVEAVNGLIKNGPGAQFVVDIPPYSSRTYGHRIKSAGEPFRIEASEWKGGPALQNFTATADRDLKELLSRAPLYAMYRDRLYRLGIEGRRLELSGGTGSPLSAFVGTIDANQYSQYGAYYGSWSSEELTEELRFRKMLKPLLVASLNLNSKKAAGEFSLPDDRVRLFVFAPLPQSFFIREGETKFGKQAGFVLYCIDLFQPEKQ